MRIMPFPLCSLCRLLTQVSVYATLCGENICVSLTWGDSQQIRRPPVRLSVENRPILGYAKIMSIYL